MLSHLDQFHSSLVCPTPRSENLCFGLRLFSGSELLLEIGLGNEIKFMYFNVLDLESMYKKHLLSSVKVSI